MNTLKRRIRYLQLRLKFAARRMTGAVRRSWSRRQFAVRAVLICGLAFGLAWMINSVASPDADGRANDVAVLISMAAMFGGVLAIVLALSNFMLQRAADLYSAQFYEMYARDWREKALFVAIASLAVTAFALALFQDTARVPLREWVVVYLILLMTAAVFCLVDWHYTRVTRKINPAIAIAFSEDLCLKSLAAVHGLAIDIATWLRVSDDALTQEQALAVSYTKFVAPHVALVDRQLENILEISLRLFAKGESLAGQRGLGAVRNVIARYFQLRRESSLALPVAPYWGVVESDSSNFLARNYERVNAAGEKLMAQHQSQSVVFIMDLYASLIDDAKEIRFINHPGKNPILDQLRANVSGLLDAAIRLNDLEVCFRSIDVSKAIGGAAVDRKLHAPTLTSVFADLTKVATWALTNKSTVYIEHCTGPIVGLLARAIEADTPGLEHQIREAFKDLESITVGTYLAVSGGLISGINVEFTVGKCYEQLAPALATLVTRFSRHVEGGEKRRFASNLSELFEEMYRSLRDLAETLKICDAPLIFHVASLIDDTLQHLIHLSEDADREKTLQRRDEFEKHLSWFTYLPGWFVHYAPTFKTTYVFDVLADIPAKTGLLLMHWQAWPDKAVKCTEAAFSITKDMLQKGKDRNAFDEPRHMLSICYMGVLARAQGGANVVVFNAVVKLIHDFEQQYRQAYFSNATMPAGPYVGPHPNQLMTEMLQWRDDFVRAKYNGAPLGDGSRNIIQQLVSDADVDRFIFDVWGVIPKYSSVESELTQRQRIELITRLVAVLKRKVTG